MSCHKYEFYWLVYAGDTVQNMITLYQIRIFIILTRRNYLCWGRVPHVGSVWARTYKIFHSCYNHSLLSRLMMIRRWKKKWNVIKKLFFHKTSPETLLSAAFLSLLLALTIFFLLLTTNFLKWMVERRGGRQTLKWIITQNDCLNSLMSQEGKENISHFANGKFLKTVNRLFIWLLGSLRQDSFVKGQWKLAKLSNIPIFIELSRKNVFERVPIAFKFLVSDQHAPFPWISQTNRVAQDCWMCFE